MSRRFRTTRKLSLLGFSVAALSIALLAGCSRGPSQKEMSLLEEKRQAMDAAEKKLAEKKAEQARLERKLAEKKAEKKALEEKRDATQAAISQ
jgi:septal ring factor EnvC (AmiA/AmiB activator)